MVIQDEKGKYVSTVPDGKSVSTDNAEKAVETSALDTNWQAGNLKNDVVVAQERLASIKMKLQELTKKKNWIAKVQEFLRNLFGVNSMNLPITVNSSESGISLSIDQKKLTAKNSQELLAIYEAVSVLNASDDTVDSKIKLREAILKTLPEKDAKNYREIFSRATLFDIWDSFKANMPKNSKELQAQLEKYTKQSENTEEISRLQDSLNIDKIKMFNSRMEEWKSKGYDSLSDPEWFSKTFQVDSEKLFDIVNQANDTFDSTIKKINNFVDKGVKDIINKP